MMGSIWHESKSIPIATLRRHILPARVTDQYSLTGGSCWFDTLPRQNRPSSTWKSCLFTFSGKLATFGSSHFYKNNKTTSQNGSRW